MMQNMDLPSWRGHGLLASKQIISNRNSESCVAYEGIKTGSKDVNRLVSLMGLSRKSSPRT